MSRSFRFNIFILFAAALAAALLVFAGPARATTVQDVASELECPCECPLILEDCNMSCGLEWKDEIGAQIKAGKTKEQIIEDFVHRYGEACRITPAKRIKGKVYQYTRGFDTKEWVLVGLGAGIWALAVFFGVFLAVKKIIRKKGGDGGGGA